MVRNQLPEGVGKKIVEALKRQAEADITPVSSIDGTISSNIQPVPDIVVSNANKSSDVQNNEIGENCIVEEEVSSFSTKKEQEANTETAFNIKAQKEENLNRLVSESVPETPVYNEPKPMLNFNQSNSAVNVSSYSSVPLQEDTQKISKQQTVSINIPTNVAVLRNLIASLPVGVTKQMGAQIIRQTLEAMGLPMASVLKEAQEVQEELNANTRECMLKIQEYKTNIMQLEQSVQEYQKNITQINDLVSLFLLTDRK